MGYLGQKLMGYGILRTPPPTLMDSSTTFGGGGGGKVRVKVFEEGGFFYLSAW